MVLFLIGTDKQVFLITSLRLHKNNGNDLRERFFYYFQPEDEEEEVAEVIIIIKKTLAKTNYSIRSWIADISNKNPGGAVIG